MKPLLPIFFLFTITCTAQENPCQVIAVVHNPVETAYLWSPDSTQYLVNKKDSTGIYQIFAGKKGDNKPKCISYNGPVSVKKPWPKRQKMQVLWHPSGKWIICAVEKEHFNEEWLKGTKSGRKLLEGWLACGLWMDIWAVKPDGSKWCLLATTVRGMTGPAFTPDGKLAAWAEALDSAKMTKDKFGRWRLILSEFREDSLGNAKFISTKNINPKGATWIEPGNFSPDGRSLLISADIGLTDARGQDQYILDIFSGKVINLNNTPKVWDEHGVFSPDGKKVLFMSSYPYRDDKNSYKVIGIKTEFMLMNTDGTGLQQLTHFLEPGFPEYKKGNGIAAVGFFSADGKTIYAQSLVFPSYQNWIIRFKGPCGNNNEILQNDSTIKMGAKDYLLSILKTLEPKKRNDDSLCKAVVPLDTIKSRLRYKLYYTTLSSNSPYFENFIYSIDSSCTREIEKNMFYFRIAIVNSEIGKKSNQTISATAYLWYKIWFDGKKYWLIPGHHSTDVCLDFVWTPCNSTYYRKGMAPWQECK